MHRSTTSSPRRSRAPLGVLAVALAALAALVLVGCGQGTQPDIRVLSTTSTTTAGDTPAQVLAAVDRTASATSGRIALSAELHVQAPDGTVMDGTLTGQGAFDMAADRSSMQFDMGSFVSSMAGAAGQQLPPGLGDLGTMKLVQDGTTTYLSWPLFTTMGVPTPWVSVDDRQAASGLGLGPVGSGAGDLTGRSFLEALRGVGGSVTESGTEQVDGVDTTVYSGTIDLQKALDAAPAADRDALRQALGTAGASTLPFKVWVDAEGHLRRFQMTLTMSVDGSSFQETLTVSLTELGQPQTIDVPPPDQVTPLDPSARSGLGGLGGLGSGGGGAGLGGNAPGAAGAGQPRGA